jgi:hypothetical protein
MSIDEKKSGAETNVVRVPTLTKRGKDDVE